MIALFGVIAGVAIVLAAIVTALFIGVCLVIAWITDSIRGRGQPEVTGQRDGRAVVPPAAGSRHSGRGYR